MPEQITLPQFIAKWQASTLTERSASQSHFIELCQILGQPTPTSDPTGENYTFEKGVKKTGGGDGFADVWMRDHFAWEYKGKHKDLEAAYMQLLAYREDLDNPPLLVVSDLDRFQVHTNFTGTHKQVYEFKLADLASPEPLPGKTLSALEVLRALFENPRRLHPEPQSQAVTEIAAKEFAKLAESLRRSGYAPEKAAHYLMRLLFCLFAEDILLLPAGLFSKLVEATEDRPDEFTKRISVLFDAMSAGGFFGADDIAYFNGGLFAGGEALELTKEDMATLARVCKLDWAGVEPAIFGTLFERSLDPGKRSQLGAHYTSKEDILLIIEPVLMAPLRREWEEIKSQAEALAAQRDALPKGAAKRKQEDKLMNLLREFAERIASVRVLDPACGSGNFLYMSLKQLMDLEKEVISYAARLTGQSFIPHVGPERLYGIEINPYARELAQVVVWIGYIQWLHDNGFGIPADPILKPLDNIRQMDAILDFDNDGNPVEPEWPEADVIIGNPPFLGDKRMRAELDDAYVDALRTLYGNRIPGQSDLVCYWFEKARAMVEAGTLQRVGLLATQGIRGGANRRVLERIKETGDIFWAWADRNWVLDGANVHVSMVGFDNGQETDKTLDGKRVTQINPDLTASADLTLAKVLQENQNISFIGIQRTGPFEVTPYEAKQLLDQKGNPNGRPNSDVVKPWITAIDVTGYNRNMYIIDFGVDTPIELAAEYTAPFEYIKQVVLPQRLKTRPKSLAETWWLFARPRPAMRQAVKYLMRFIVTPMVSKHRVFAWVLDKDIIPENLLVIIAKEDDYFFGALQSRPHELWSRIKGTQLREAESGSRYTPTSTFETFPFPWPPGKEPQDDPRVEAIAEAAKELVAKRDAWLNPPGASEAELKKRTLTKLYNERPTWLEQAHKKLDDAVLDAYTWPHDISSEEILERLLELNLERAAGQ